MDGDKGQDATASPSVQKALKLIEGLRDHPSGRLIYQQIESILTEESRGYRAAENTYAAILGNILDALAEHVPAEDPLRLEIRLVQHRLRPPLLATELRSLRHCVERWSHRIAELAQTDHQLVRQALAPLLDDFGMAAPGAEETTAEPQPVPPAAEHPEAPAPEPEPETRFAAPEPTETSSSEAEQKVDLVYRRHLDRSNQDLQELQETLSEHVREVISQHEQFGVLLELALAELKDQKGPEDVEKTRQFILGEVRKYFNSQRQTMAQLENSYEALQRISQDSRRLNEELSRVRQLSLTDELTDLPNRRAFQRRLEEEVARVNRYASPLTLAMIDLDEFKQINDTYGHSCGDAVLLAYANRILSLFRHQDMVARYGGEEFAVLLPNTDLDGAERALAKVRAQAEQTRVDTEGCRIPVPSFSAGMTLYRRGEPTSSFMARVDAALYQAKAGGRNRTEIAREDQTSQHGRPER